MLNQIDALYLNLKTEGGEQEIQRRTAKRSKTCSRCTEVKALELFPRASSCIDGTRSYCKQCDAKRKNQHYIDNKDRYHALSAAWVEANPEGRADINKRYREKIKRDGREIAYKRSWRQANLDYARAVVSARRKKLRTATPTWVNINEIVLIYQQAAAQGMTVDHIIPITHEQVCGLHVPWNLEIVSSSENYSKNNLFNGVRTKKRKMEKKHAPSTA